MNLAIAHKPEVEWDDFLDAHPNLFIVFGYFLQYAKFAKVPVVITSLFTDSAEGRISQTHATGRAMDLSVRGWTPQQLNGAVAFLEGRCNQMGAVGKDGKRRVIIVHNSGSGDHIHLQCAP